MRCDSLRETKTKRRKYSCSVLAERLERLPRVEVLAIGTTSSPLVIHSLDVGADFLIRFKYE